VTSSGTSTRYWSRSGRYFAGDGAKKDDDGDIWLLGRVDDVMNVSGHRIVHTEVGRPGVPPAGPRPPWWAATDATTGRHRRVRHPAGTGRGEELAQELRGHVAKEIGPIARPRAADLSAERPKTRSGKIMRRLLRDIAENRSLAMSRRSPTRR